VSTPFDIARLLRSRRWALRTSPFPHVAATEVFDDAFKSALEVELGRLLARGLGRGNETHRLARNMPYSDAYGWNLPPRGDGPLAFFYSRPWHDLLAGLWDVPATGDVNAAVHYHPVGSANGSVHRDLGVAWFSDQARDDGINPMDLARCGYTTGRASAPGIAVREVVRAVTMIYYLGNRSWSSGDGGETGLYRREDDPVDEPALRIAPIDNTMLVFENTPSSYHSFLCNRRHARTSIILWLHRSKDLAIGRFGHAVRLAW